MQRHFAARLRPYPPMAVKITSEDGTVLSPRKVGAGRIEFDTAKDGVYSLNL